MVIALRPIAGSVLAQDQFLVPRIARVVSMRVPLGAGVGGDGKPPSPPFLRRSPPRRALRARRPPAGRRSPARRA